MHYPHSNIVWTIREHGSAPQHVPVGHTHYKAPLLHTLYGGFIIRSSYMNTQLCHALHSLLGRLRTSRHQVDIEIGWYGAAWMVTNLKYFVLPSCKTRCCMFWASPMSILNNLKPNVIGTFQQERSLSVIRTSLPPLWLLSVYEPTIAYDFAYNLPLRVSCPLNSHAMCIATTCNILDFLKIGHNTLGHYASSLQLFWRVCSWEAPNPISLNRKVEVTSCFTFSIQLLKMHILPLF